MIGLAALVARAQHKAQAVEARAQYEKSWVSNPAEWLKLMFGGGPSATGITVTPIGAMRSSGVWACVRVVSEDLASLPLIFYRRLDSRAKERAVDHPMYELLHDLPNEEMDSMQFVETMQAWSELWPCGYAEIERNELGVPVAFWPIYPERVTPLRIKPSPQEPGELVFRVELPTGQVDPVTGAPWTLLSRERMFRLRQLSLDGVDGLGTVRHMTEPIALSLALEQHGARFFSAGATPGGVIEVPAEMSPEALARLRAAWEARHKGLANAHRVALLEEGAVWKQTGVDNKGSEYVDGRRFQLEELARIYRVPPHLIQDLSRSTNNNIEHQSIDYVTHTLRPRAVRWERAISTQVLTRAERREYFAEFLLDALLRGDSKTRAETLEIKRRNGIINGDEWRQYDNENPLPNGQGEAYLVQAQMVTLDRVINPPAPTPPPAPAAAPPDAPPTAPPPPAEGQAPDDQAPDAQAAEDEPPARSVDLQAVLMPIFRRQLVAVRVRTGRNIAAEVRKRGAGRGFNDWLSRYLAEELQAYRSVVETFGEAVARLTGGDVDAAARHAGQAAAHYVRTITAELEAAGTARGAIAAVAAAWEGQPALDQLVADEFARVVEQAAPAPAAA